MQTDSEEMERSRVSSPPVMPKNKNLSVDNVGIMPKEYKPTPLPSLKWDHAGELLSRTSLVQPGFLNLMPVVSESGDSTMTVIENPNAGVDEEEEIRQSVGFSRDMVDSNDLNHTLNHTYTTEREEPVRDSDIIGGYGLYDHYYLRKI